MTVTFEAKVDDLDPSHPAVTTLPYAEAAVRQIVAQAIGYGSACWEDLEGAGVFQSDDAAAGVEAAVAAIIDATNLGEPNLGCATTAELREELACRDAAGPPSSDDNYRTVDA